MLVLFKIKNRPTILISREPERSLRRREQASTNLVLNQKLERVWVSNFEHSPLDLETQTLTKLKQKCHKKTFCLFDWETENVIVSFVVIMRLKLLANQIASQLFCCEMLKRLI